MEETEITETENVENELFDQVKALVDELQLTIESLEDANTGLSSSYLINGERIDNKEIFNLKERLIEHKTFLEDKLLKINE
jgi:hypothetical protein